MHVVRIFLLSLSLVIFANPLVSKEVKGKGNQSNWNVLEQKGVNYVTAQNIADFYQFDTVKRADDGITILMYHAISRMGIKIRAGKDYIFVNGIRFRLFHPVSSGKIQGEILVSVNDVSRIIEPVLRPSHVERRHDANNVAVTITGDPPLSKRFEIDVLRKQFEKIGWKIVEDNVERSLELELHFSAAPKNTNEISATAEWFTTPVRTDKRRESLAIAFATAMHLKMVKSLNAKDGGVVPREIPSLPSKAPRVAVRLSVPAEFENFEWLPRLLAESLANEAEVNRNREQPVAEAKVDVERPEPTR